MTVRNLTISLNSEKALVRAIDFHVEPDKTLAIVGESGSGKNLSRLAVPGLLPAEIQLQGKIVCKKCCLYSR
ncbi:hypothetical protein [uncultured Cedecea sp.]|uniref:hypothetical protein n=1 Tax=uncultured Cedecea sp. TaxID=988762 RepID=UPI0026240A70|nr:hypothetical protein [uncultured Cedecea sp.]